MDNHQIRIAVVVKIGNGKSTAHVPAPEVFPGGSTADEAEFSFHVLPDKWRLGVRGIAPHVLQIAVCVSVRNDDIGPAIKIEVREGRTPPNPGEALGGQAPRAADILEQ